MHERTNIQLSQADRSKLRAVVANRNSPQKHAWRAKIVLLTADGRGTAEIMQATGKAKMVIWRWQERFRDEGAAGLWRDQHQVDDPLNGTCRQRLFAGLARLVACEPGNAFRHEARLPSPNHRLRFARTAHDFGGATAVSRGKDDVGAPHMLLRRAAVRDNRLKLAAVCCCDV